VFQCLFLMLVSISKDDYWVLCFYMQLWGLSFYA